MRFKYTRISGVKTVPTAAAEPVFDLSGVDVEKVVGFMVVSSPSNAVGSKIGVGESTITTAGPFLAPGAGYNEDKIGENVPDPTTLNCIGSVAGLKLFTWLYLKVGV